eukprot:gene8370-8554_t
MLKALFSSNESMQFFNRPTHLQPFKLPEATQALAAPEEKPTQSLGHARGPNRKQQLAAAVTAAALHRAQTRKRRPERHPVLTHMRGEASAQEVTALVEAAAAAAAAALQEPFPGGYMFSQPWVHVLERRGHPGQQEADKKRTYLIGLGERGLGALDGLELQVPPAGLSAFLVDEAAERFPQAVTFHWHAAPAALDLQARTVTWQEEQQPQPEAVPSLLQCGPWLTDHSGVEGVGVTVEVLQGQDEHQEVKALWRIWRAGRWQWGHWQEQPS